METGVCMDIKIRGRGWRMSCLCPAPRHKTLPTISWQPLEAFFDDSPLRHPWAELGQALFNRRLSMIDAGFSPFYSDAPIDQPADLPFYGTYEPWHGALALRSAISESLPSYIDNVLPINDGALLLSAFREEVRRLNQWMQHDCLVWSPEESDKIASHLADMSNLNAYKTMGTETWLECMTKLRECVDCLGVWFSKGATEVPGYVPSITSLPEHKYFTPWPFVHYRHVREANGVGRRFFASYIHSGAYSYRSFGGVWQWRNVSVPGSSFVDMPIALDPDTDLYQWTRDVSIIMGSPYYSGRFSPKAGDYLYYDSHGYTDEALTRTLTRTSVWYFHFDTTAPEVPPWVSSFPFPWVSSFYSPEGRTWEGMYAQPYGLGSQFDYGTEVRGDLNTWVSLRTKESIPSRPYEEEPSRWGCPSLEMNDRIRYKVNFPRPCKGTIKVSVKPKYDLSDSGPIQLKPVTWHGPVEPDDQGNILTKYYEIDDLPGMYHHDFTTKVSGNFFTINGRPIYDVWDYNGPTGSRYYYDGHPEGTIYYDIDRRVWYEKQSGHGVWLPMGYGEGNYAELPDYYNSIFIYFFATDIGKSFKRNRGSSTWNEIPNGLECDGKGTYTQMLSSDATLFFARDDDQISDMIVGSIYEKRSGSWLKLYGGVQNGRYIPNQAFTGNVYFEDMEVKYHGKFCAALTPDDGLTGLITFVECDE